MGKLSEISKAFNKNKNRKKPGVRMKCRNCGKTFFDDGDSDGFCSSKCKRAYENFQDTGTRTVFRNSD
jgi:uncharacterized OB-fold protein